MSTPSGKYDKAGWTKYEFPPDMITAEQNEKKMKLAWPQIKRLMGKQIESRIYSSAQAGDNVSAKEWKALSVRMQAKDMSQRINEEFIQDFMKWLTGRSTFNSTKYFEIMEDEFGAPVSKEVTGGCPWGNKPLTNLPGVSEFLDQGIDRRSKVIEYISKLKLRGPRNLDESYMYYKYILRKVAVDDDACFEVQEMADFDYPVDPETGETVGPAQVATPPLFDEVRYTANFLMVYSLTVQSPALAAEWILNGAKAFDLEKLGTGIVTLIDPRDTASFLNTNDYDMIRQAGGKYMYVKDWVSEADGEDEYIERHEQARRMTRERERRRKLRKAGRGPSAKMAAGATSKKGIDLNIFLGPDGRQQSRRLTRREARRDDRIDDEREDLATALTEESFGTKNYVSFWAMSPGDQDYIMAMLLAQNAFASAAQVLKSPSSTGAAGGPVSFPEARRNEEKFAYPGEETEKEEKGTKKKGERLQDVAKRIRTLPGAESDPATQKILKDIYKTVERIANKKDTVPKVTVQNNQPINIDNNGLIASVKANTVMIEKLNAVIGKLDVKIGNLNFDGPRNPPPLQIPEAFRTRMDSIDNKLGTVVNVLNGLPPEIAKYIPRPPPGAGGVGSAVPVNPDQIMTDREEINIGSATVHNPTGPWTVQNQKVDNNYTVGDLNFGHITGESIGQGLGKTMGAPNVNVYPNVDVRPDVNVSVDASGIKVPTPQVNITVDGETLKIPVPQVNVSLDATQIPVPDIYPQVNVGNVNLPESLGEKIGQNIKIPEFGVNIDVDRLGGAIGRSITAQAGDVNVDLGPLTQALENHVSEQKDSKADLMRIQAEHSRQIGDLYKELKEMRTQENTRLDTMKQILDKMTPLQTAVAGILANDPATKDIEGDVEIKEKSLGEKLGQVIGLDQDTINKLVDGNAKGLTGIKEEIQKLITTVNDNLSMDIENNSGLVQKTGLVQITHQLLKNAAYQNNVLARTMEYIPKDMRDGISPNLFTLLTDKLSDPTSIFNNAEVKVAEINDKTFGDMAKKVTDIEKQLKDGGAALELQKGGVELLRQELLKKYDTAVADATEQTTQQKEQIKAEMIGLRNMYASKEAEFTQKVNEYAVLASSHAAILKEFETYKTKTTDKGRILKETLKDVIGTELKPLIEKSSQNIVDAIDLSLGAGADDDGGDGGDKDGPGGDSGPGLSKEEKKEAVLVGEAQHATYEYLQKQNELPAEIKIQPPEVFVDRAALETKRTLEQLIDEQISRDPNSSVYSILKSPIEEAVQTLQHFKEEKGGVSPEQLSVSDRLKRNQLFAAEAYNYNLNNRFGNLPDTIRQTFLDPIAGQSPEARIKSVTTGLTLLTKEKNSVEQSKSSFKRFTELITDFSGATNRMAEEPGWNGRSKLAEDYIGKLGGTRIREMTEYKLNDRTSIQPTNASEIDGYATLVRVGRQMEAASKRGDHVTFQELVRHTQSYTTFNSVPFVSSSPLYSAMVNGDQQNITHALSAIGTGHINRTYFTTAAKTRTDLLYHSFKNHMSNTSENTQDSVEGAAVDHAIKNTEKSGMSDSTLAAHPEYSKHINSVSMEEASVYLQAFMRAAMGHNMMKMNLHDMAGQEKGADTIQMLAKTKSVLGHELTAMKKQFDMVADNSSRLQIDNPNNQTIQTLYADRQASIKALSMKMYDAMALSVTPEFQRLAKPDQEIQQSFTEVQTSTVVEAVDTLVGFTDGNILHYLNQTAEEMESPDITALPSGKLFASQLKNAVEALDKEASVPIEAMSKTSNSAMAKLMGPLRNSVFEQQLKDQFKNVFDGLPVALAA